MGSGIGGFGSQTMGRLMQQQSNALDQQAIMNMFGQQQHIAPGQLIKLKPKETKRSFMKLFRDYIEAHRDTIFTLMLILLADHYIFKGAFADTIKAAFSKLLAQAHKKIDEKIEAKL